MVTSAGILTQVLQAASQGNDGEQLINVISDQMNFTRELDPILVIQRVKEMTGECHHLIATLPQGERNKGHVTASRARRRTLIPGPALPLDVKPTQSLP